MAEWQTIDTAPKDGTWFLAYRPRASLGTSDRVVVVRWHNGSDDFAWPTDVFDIYVDDLDERNERGFYTHDTYESRGTFTHWIPLPEPPK